MIGLSALNFGPGLRRYPHRQGTKRAHRWVWGYVWKRWIGSRSRPFNIFWHTPFDTVGKCSAASLGIVGRVLLDALDDLESGRMPRPMVAFREMGDARTTRQQIGR
jgi:hypothetical protein